MKQLTAKDNRAFAHMTTQAADLWAVISVLKLARLFGIRFIFAVLVRYLATDIDYSIEKLEAANVEQISLIKKLGKIISIDAGLKAIFGGVRVHDMKSVIDYNQTPDGPAYKWIMANQADLMRIDWKEFEKRVKSGSVGDDCPVKFELESSVSVNYEDLLKFHGPPSERMVILMADEFDEPNMGLSEAAILYPDTNPAPAPIQVEPSEITANHHGDNWPSLEAPSDPPPVPVEVAPQATGGTYINDAGEVLAHVDKPEKQIKPDDEFPDDIPF